MNESVSQVPAYGDDRAVVQSWRVPHSFGGSRADVYLAEKIGRISREKCRLLIARGDFRRQDLPIKPSTRLGGGDEVSFWRIPPDAKPEQNWEVNILAESPDFLVIDKPPHLAVHPTALHYYRTVTYWLRRRSPETTTHICHRLDKETSGVLVCAKNAKCESLIKKGFEQNQHQKWYLAVVRGCPQGTHFQVDAPLSLQGDRGLVRIKMIADAQGLKSQTVFQVLAADPDSKRALVLCKPRTGRQHQIRAHLAIAGYPIVGDKLYGMGEPFFDALSEANATEAAVLKRELEHPRHALHAYAIQVAGLETGFFAAPFPTELAALMPPLAAAETQRVIQGELEKAVGRKKTKRWLDQSRETQT